MENRRSRMTKRLLKESFAEILSSGEYRGISVRRICERADLNRSTFYLHYETIDDLWEEYTNEMMAKVWEAHQLHMSVSDYQATLKYILSKAEIFKSLLKAGMFHSYIMKQYQKLDFGSNHELKRFDKNAYLLISAYTVSGMEQLLLYMLENPICNFSLDAVAEAIYQLNETALGQIPLISDKKANHNIIE